MTVVTHNTLIAVMNCRAVLHLVVLSLGPGAARGTFIGDSDRPGHHSCNGSLLLFYNTSAPSERIAYVRRGELDRVTNITTTRIWKAEVEGCGCVVIYSSLGCRGKSAFLSPPQTVQEGVDRAFFKTVKSFKIVRCNKTNILEAVVVSVVVGVLLVGLAGIIFIRRWRLFGREDSEPLVEVTDIEEIPGQQTRPEERVEETEI